MNISDLVAAMAAKYKIRLDESDPAFIMVDLNQIVLKEVVAEVLQGQAGLIKDISQRSDKLIDDIESAAWSAADAASQKAKLNIEIELQQICGKVAQEISKTAQAKMGKKPFTTTLAETTVILLISFFSFSTGFFLKPYLQPEHAAVSKDALKLSSLGESSQLLNCSKPGWTTKDGFCYTTPTKEGVINGWRIK